MPIRISTVAMLCGLLLGVQALGQDLGSLQAGTYGGSSSEANVRTVNLSDLPLGTEAEISQHYTMLRPRDGRTDAEYAQMKREAAALTGSARYSSPAGNPAPSWRSAQLHTTLSFIGQSERCCTPSDMALAVGPGNYEVQFVNTFIAVYVKGVLQSGYPKSATTFFGLPSGTYTTDPRGVYDWVNKRYIFVMLTESSFSSNNVGKLLIAVSASSNPTGSWHITSIQVGNTGECPDYPTLGHDTNDWGTNGHKGAIYVGINQFSNNCNGGFIRNYMFVIPKDKPYAGSGWPYWFQFGFTVGGTLVDTLQPANPQGFGDHPSAEYLTNSFNILWNCQNGCKNLTLWSVNNVAAFTTGGPGPTFAGKVVPTVNTYHYPPNANQPGSATSVDSGDARISGSMYYHAGHLYGSLETGVPNVPGAHPIWFDYHPLLDSNFNISGGDERQEDCFACGGQGASGSAYYATLIPDNEDNLTMTYTYSDNSTYPEMAVTGRRVSWIDSNMNGTGYVIAGGSGLYTQGRWGDYSAVAPDNSSPHLVSMWTAGDYDNSGNWGTAISQERYTSPKDQ